MAEKRMFTKSVIDTDAFMSMPATAQCLYFHLAMRADDAGFVGNPQIIRRVVGSSEEDFQILLDKRYLLQFDSGVVVIKHWWMHNVIKNDRMRRTTYVEELDSLELDDKNAYTEKKGFRDDSNLEPTWNHPGTKLEPSGNQDDSNLEPQYKVIENKVNECNNIPPSNEVGAAAQKGAGATLTQAQMRRFEAFWKAYPKKVEKQDAIRAWKKINPDDELTNTIIRAVEEAKVKDSRFREARYIPYPASWLNAGNWENDYDDYTPPRQESQYSAPRPKFQPNDDHSFDSDDFLDAAVQATIRSTKR